MINDLLTPGDHIRIWRPRYRFYHHGIYIGNNEVIHYTGNEKNINLQKIRTIMHLITNRLNMRRSSTRSIIWSALRNHRENKLCIVKTSLERFTKKTKNLVEIIKYREENTSDIVISRAYNRSGERQFNLFKNNCEHFCNYCKIYKYVPEVILLKIYL